MDIYTKDDQKYLDLSFNKIYEDTDLLVEKLSDKEWKGIIAVTRGGLFPAMALANKLGIKNIETIGVASYHTAENQGSLEMVKEPNYDLIGDGEGWLLVEDLSDTGNSLRYIKEIIPNAHVATVYIKPAGADAVDTYVSEIPQDVWIVFPWEEGDDLPAHHNVKKKPLKKDDLKPGA